jgi:glyoxylase-like metal-dependent hydrolase (beta-lactamase superfamily II)
MKATKFIVDAAGAPCSESISWDSFREITGLFLTHHHSDHVGLDLWLTGWIGRPWANGTSHCVWGGRPDK